jgi:pyrroline-5-carboxylate reductase
METLISDSQLTPSQVSKFICLPSIARHQGTSLLYTSTQNSILFNLLTAMGGYVLCSSEDQLSISMISTVFMGPFYGTMRHQRNWLMSRGGWSSSDATRLVLSQYYGMIQDALQRQMSIDTVLDDLLTEQTPGGLNEQAYSILSSQGVWDAYDVAMDTVVARIQGSSKIVDTTTDDNDTSDNST